MLVISQPTAAGAVLSKKGGAACWHGPGAALPAQPSLCLAPFQGPVSGVVQQGLRAPLRHGAGEDPRFLPSTEPKRPRDQDLRSWEAAVSRRTADSPVSWAGAGTGERGAGIQLRGGTPRHIFISFLLTWAGAPLWRAMGCCSHAGGLLSSCHGALPPPLQGQGQLPPPSPLLPLLQRGEAKPCTTGGLRAGWASEVLLSHGKERGLGVTPKRKAAGPG